MHGVRPPPRFRVQVASASAPPTQSFFFSRTGPGLVFRSGVFFLPSAVDTASGPWKQRWQRPLNRRPRCHLSSEEARREYFRLGEGTVSEATEGPFLDVAVVAIHEHRVTGMSR